MYLLDSIKEVKIQMAEIITRTLVEQTNNLIIISFSCAIDPPVIELAIIVAKHYDNQHIAKPPL